MPGWRKQTVFGPRVRKALEWRGWSIRALAVLVECSEGFLGRVLRGEQEPTWSLACAIAEQLEVRLDDLAEQDPGLRPRG